MWKQFTVTIPELSDVFNIDAFCINYKKIYKLNKNKTKLKIRIKKFLYKEKLNWLKKKFLIKKDTKYNSKK